MATAEAKPARREALIVAADKYGDPKLRALRAPARDAEALARVLGNPDVGDFHVDVSLNEPDHLVRRKLSEFFRDRGRDDLLLLHMSCHGLKDEDGTLYFASTNTEMKHLEATAIPSEFVNRQMSRSRSRRIVLLLDCCFGGAFARGLTHRAGESVAIKEEFEGQGRVVLTASRAMEYAFEGDSLEGDAHPSIFTSAIVEGLESGDADYDGDSRISIDELYDYVYDRVRETTPSQTPSKWTFDVYGDLYVARSPFREPKPVPLPTELQAAIGSPFAHVRAGAVEELAGLSTGTDAGLAAAARIALEGLTDDDSKRVSDAAARGLAGAPSRSTQVPVVPALEPAHAAFPEPVAPRRQREPTSPPSSRISAVLARAASRQDALALVGAALLVFGYFRKASWETAWYFAKELDAIWYFWSPVDALAAVLLVVLAVLGSRRGYLVRAAADGLLLGVGLMVLAAMVSFGSGDFEFGDTFVLTTIGAAGIAGAGVLGLLTRRPTKVAWPRGASGLAAAGAGLGLSTLVVNMADWAESGLVESGGPAPYLEVLVAGAAGLLGLVLFISVPRARLPAGGALIAVGTLLAFHMAGIVVQVAHYEGADSIRVGGPLGIVAGLLLVASGISAVRAEQREELPVATGVPAT
jgi:hypothetical protein